MSSRRRRQAEEGCGLARAASSQTKGQSHSERGLDKYTSADSWLVAGCATQGRFNLSEFPTLQKEEQKHIPSGVIRIKLKCACQKRPHKQQWLCSNTPPASAEPPPLGRAQGQGRTPPRELLWHAHGCPPACVASQQQACRGHSPCPVRCLLSADRGHGFLRSVPPLRAGYYLSGLCSQVETQPSRCAHPAVKFKGPQLSEVSRCARALGSH